MARVVAVSLRVASIDLLSGVTMVYHGWVSDFWEQGMEGERWHLFQDAAHAQGREQGWRREGMLLLQSGDELTIFADDGSLRWQGVLLARRLRWFGRKVSPHESAWHPHDVTVELWQGWFRQQPALIATLVRKS